MFITLTNPGNTKSNKFDTGIRLYFEKDCFRNEWEYKANIVLYLEERLFEIYQSLYTSKF